MRSTFFGLNIALKGLQAQRQALEVTAHNVANANTEGYTRQEAVMQAGSPFTFPVANRAIEAGQMGTGVEVAEIRRMQDSFLDKQVREQLSAQGRWDMTSDYLQEVESVLNEPSDSGLGALMNKFWASWQDLSSDPQSYDARASVVQNASVLADVIRRDYAQIATFRERADQEIEAKIVQVNDWLSQVAELNRQIMHVQVAGDQANDLSDKRDILLNQLVTTVKVAYREETDGSVSVWLNSTAGEQLVSGSTTYALRENGAMGPIQRDDGTGTWTGVTVNDGELAGLLTVRDSVTDPTVVDSIANRLNELAKNIISVVNGYHSAGFAPDDSTGRVFFGSNDSTASVGAADIAVNPTLVSNPNLLAASEAIGQPGSGEQALVIASALQSEVVTINAKSTTLANWYKAMISKLGIDSQEAQAMFANQKLLVDHLANNREAFSGVSLDEEATNMVRFERAYQAAARVMTTMDQMLDTLVNNMGVVGR